MAEDKRQLLRELRIFEASDIKPAESENGILTMSGILQTANRPNANKRIYPHAILEREDRKMQEVINSRGAIGELDHPDSAVVQLENGSHLITKTWWDGDNLMGEIEVLDTPKGRILESLCKRKVRLGISSRGLGSVKRTNEGHDLVEDDFQLITYDIVSNPSTSGAFMQLKESVEYRVLSEQNKLMRINDVLDEILEL